MFNKQKIGLNKFEYHFICLYEQQLNEMQSEQTVEQARAIFIATHHAKTINCNRTFFGIYEHINIYVAVFLCT